MSLRMVKISGRVFFRMLITFSSLLSQLRGATQLTSRRFPYCVTTCAALPTTAHYLLAPSSTSLSQVSYLHLVKRQDLIADPDVIIIYYQLSGTTSSTSIG